jgi:CheY-like chemotaxis protein
MDVCRRCQGLMMPDRVWDGRVATVAWRCIVCGEFVDEVIQRNRTSPRPRERHCRTSIYTHTTRLRRPPRASLSQAIVDSSSQTRLGTAARHHMVVETVRPSTTIPSAQSIRPEEAMNDTLASARSSWGRVLVVDTSEVIRLTVRLILSRKGYQILEATSAQEALTLLERGNANIDTILCDTETKGTDGTEAISVLRKTFPSIPLIVIGEPDRVDDALAKYRLADHLLKPLAERRMLEVVPAVVRLHQLRAQ